ncbi:tRNA (guanosine(37)-N1)-methyltransferase TrmD [Candidatus Tisiphia endosymbiont of Myopa tessellatipennis]|uniref:tRNA (guanosine(37)-N1)-methyltransferase TrmD n=1 Tax=Candidatus Tisiphia endosymbiont of Myopa tessellatipennis TaxID=3066257 RepID=UPI00313C380D
MSSLHASILTIFPEMFPGFLQYSLAGQALEKGIWSYNVVNIKDFGLTRHKNVDDEPYGGGNGLIMRPDVVGSCIDHVLSSNPNAKIYYPSPRGKLFNQNIAREIIQEKQIIILCGRFEGVDERIIEEYNVTEISIGDYILSGGEVAALAILDCLIRLLPNVLLNQDTLQSESFEENGEFAGLLECPLYTRPAKWKSREVPSILLSGNHQLIRDWKSKQSLEITKKRRSDLLNIYRSLR